MRFDTLIHRAWTCTRCPDLAGKHAVLAAENGTPSAEVLFVGEAPGRFGCDSTRVPFHGDQSGDNFEHLLGVAGLTRSDCFVTNGVLCNPLDDEGRNRRPRAAELQNCSALLADQVRLVDPAVVVPVGATGLDALDRVEHHGLALKTSVARPHDWSGRVLYPVYHTSPLARTHRSPEQQERDWERLGELVRGP